MNFQNLNFDYVEPPRGSYPTHTSYYPQSSSARGPPRRTRSSPSSPSIASPRGPIRRPDAGFDDSSLGSFTPEPPSVIPHAPSPPSASSGTEIYGPERLFGRRLPPAQAPFPPSSPSLPTPPPLAPAAFARLRAEPNLTLDQLIEMSLQAEMEGRQLAGVLGMSIKDEIAWEAGRVTPGVDDTPYVLYALEALTRERENTGALHGHDKSAASSGGDSTFYNGLAARGVLPPLVQEPEPAVRRGDAAPRENMDNFRKSRPPTTFAPHKAPTAQSSLSTLVHDAPTNIGGPSGRAPAAAPVYSPPPKESWTVIDMTRTPRDVQRLNPAANFRPPVLRLVPMIVLMVLCLLMIVGLIFSAVYSQLRIGFVAYAGTIHNGQYFLFRIVPQLLAAVILLWAQAVISATLRVLPFARLASPSPSERRGAIFEDLYQPSIFLMPPLTKGIGGQQPWQVWAAVLVTWITSLTLPLQSSLFAVIFVNGTHWRWAAVQGVVWTLVAMYVTLIASLVSLTLFWHTRGESTGLIWDARSIADVAALVAHGGDHGGHALQDYRGTEVLANKDELRWALRAREADRLAFWSTAEYRPDYWYTLGALNRYDQWLRHNPDEKNPARPPPRVTSAHEYREKSSQSEAEKLEGEIDIEASPHSPAVRYRYLPWCMRTSPILFFAVAAGVLLVALLVVSFLPSTNIRGGFLPGLAAGPVAGAFSAANFLYSFLPSLLGLVLFLLFQALDAWLRILQPWGELSQHRRSLRGGALADRSVLADYAACLPLQASLKAARNGHWRVAAVSLLSTLFVLIPVLGGGVFFALTRSDGEVRMLPNVPAYAVLLSLLGLYFLALVSLIPGRKGFRLPHGVTCLAEIISFVANDDTVADPAFRGVRNKTTLRGKIGVDRRADEQDRWVFGLGPGKDPRLGVRRLMRYTELQRRVSRRQQRQTTFTSDRSRGVGAGRAGDAGRRVVA